MLFQSLEFIFFLILVFLIYWKMPNKYRWGWLLAAGYYFYALLNWKYAFLLLAITILAFSVAIKIEKAETAVNKIYMICYIIVVLSILGVYKYLGFLAEIVHNMSEALGIHGELPILDIILPVGISFYLFQTLGYVIDVYNGKTKAEKHFGYFATSVAFFPILLSGPIERIQNLTRKLKENRKFTYEEGWAAIEQIMIGYLKKLIIADSLAAFVDKVYTDVEGYQGLPLLLVIFLFSIQIYCDFSGYSDIAIGVARLFGIQIQQNFRQPYFADSIKDFWRRWHISLSSWFRDYVYIPLGGNRVSAWKKNINLLITFLLSGLWHGAGWTFILWGGIHGILQVFENQYVTWRNRKRNAIRVPTILKQLCVFLLVSIAWVFFKANTLYDAWFVLTHGFIGIVDFPRYLQNGILGMGMTIVQMGMLAFFGFGLFLYDMRQEKKEKIKFFEIKMLILIEMALFYYMRYGTDNSTFIYFQF